MIQVTGLRKAFNQRLLFNGVTFAINQGERIGLVGRNGIGKTTLFRLLVGEEQPNDGSISIPKQYRIGYLTQHLGFTAETVLQEGCLGLTERQWDRDETYRVKAVLAGLGFSDADFEVRPEMLAGGFQVRLNLAKVLVSSPNLLLLDEPTNYLDLPSLRWLARFLREWKGELMIITHDRDFMDSVTTHTMVIHRGETRKVKGPTHKLYSQILKEEEIYELTRVNDEKKRRETEEFIARFRAQATRARAVQSRIKALQRQERREKLETIRNLEFTFRSAPFTGRCLLEAKDVSFSYDPGSPLIEKLSITVGSRDRIGVIGRNGRGKTTLLKILAGEVEPQSGYVIRHPQMLTGYFGQMNINRLNPAKTVEEELLGAHAEMTRAAARGICGTMMFSGDDAVKTIEVLSGGEKSRVLLGKLLVRPVNLLILDEPTNHLDMESVDAFIEAMDAFDGGIIIVTHSEMILNAVASSLVVFESDGIRVFGGTYQEFLDRVGWQDEPQPPGSRKDAATPVRRDLRRLRAEIIDSRSRVLNDLKKRIAMTEEVIVGLEGEIEINNRNMARASEKGAWQDVAALSRSVKAAERSIEEFFVQLEMLSEEHEKQTRYYDAKIGELQIGKG